MIAPDEIWIHPQSERSLWFAQPIQNTIYREVKYIRADLHEAEIAKIKSVTRCAYCGHEVPIDDEAAIKISEHIMKCPKHPMRVCEAEITKPRTALETGEELLKGII